MNLPKPNIVRCFVEPGSEPLSAMELRWSADSADRVWHLPDGVTLKGPAPTRFGVAIHRLGENTYQVHVLWNRLSLNWNDLTRLQIMSGSLAVLLRALGTDVWDLLNQPADVKRKVA